MKLLTSPKNPFPSHQGQRRDAGQLRWRAQGALRALSKRWSSGRIKGACKQRGHTFEPPYPCRSFSPRSGSRYFQRSKKKALLLKPYKTSIFSRVFLSTRVRRIIGQGIFEKMSLKREISCQRMGHGRKSTRSAKITRGGNKKFSHNSKGKNDIYIVAVKRNSPYGGGFQQTIEQQRPIIDSHRGNYADTKKLAQDGSYPVNKT